VGGTASGLCSVVSLGIGDALLNLVLNSRWVKNVACMDERRYEQMFPGKKAW
jgi:hypothetical protein